MNVSSVDNKDPYAVLGLARCATVREIRTAHRRLVIRLHPDRNSDPCAEQQFRRVQQAYELLRDPMRRAALDRDWEVQAAAERECSGAARRYGAETQAKASQTSRNAAWAESHSKERVAATASPQSSSWTISAAEAAEWLAAELEELGPPLPPVESPTQKRASRIIALAMSASSLFLVAWGLGAVAALAGVLMMCCDFRAILGALLLLTSPVLPFVAHRLPEQP